MRGFFCLVLLLLFCTGGYAQVAKRLSREAIDSLKNPVLAAEDERTLFFVSQQIDMGVIYESDAPIEVAFKFVNSGSKKERITSKLASSLFIIWRVRAIRSYSFIFANFAA